MARKLSKRRTPYEVLGVGKDADGEALKKAYRKRSRETHPDRGGSCEEFREVSTAFAVLSSPERRKRYEETGDDSERIEDSWRKVLVQAFLQILRDLVNSGNTDSLDLVELVRKRLREQAQQGEESLRHLRKVEAGLRGVLKRLKDPKGFLLPIIEGQLAGVLEDLARATAMTEDFTAALKYVEDCRYVYERPPAANSPLERLNFKSIVYNSW